VVVPVGGVAVVGVAVVRVSVVRVAGVAAVRVAVIGVAAVPVVPLAARVGSVGTARDTEVRLLELRLRELRVVVLVRNTEPEQAAAPLVGPACPPVGVEAVLLQGVTAARRVGVLRVAPVLARPRPGPRSGAVRRDRPGPGGAYVRHPGLRSALLGQLRMPGAPGSMAVAGLGHGVGGVLELRLRLRLGFRHRRVPAECLLRRAGRQPGQHHPSVVADEHRAHGDVAVGPAVRVQDAQCRQHVGGDLGGPVRGEGLLREQCGQRTGRDTLAHYPQRAVLGEDVEDLVQPGVVGDPRGRLRRLDGAQHRRVRGPPRRAAPATAPDLPGHGGPGETVPVEHLRVHYLRQRDLSHQDFVSAVGVERPGLGELVRV
jgi:hypothetical protein